ncbi:MAG: hypothetical protein PHU04_01565 [Candidatus Peribacteraceae bacterium]|nr:hypothetical protein [Candidatus Peribacteraceae bacterium]
MKYAHRLTNGIVLASIVALAGCSAGQPPAEPAAAPAEEQTAEPALPPEPAERKQSTAIFHASSYDILVAWDDAPFTKDFPGDALQILEELQYPDNSERYLTHATPVGYHFVDYYPSFDTLQAALNWQEDASADGMQVAGGCAVTPTDPLVQGFPAYKEQCYFNPAPAVSGAYDTTASIVTYTHCLIPISTPPGEQGVLYFWGIDDDGYDECAFLAGLSQKNLSIELLQQAG